MTGAGWGGWGNATAAPGSNPFPGADAGVYLVANPPTFVERSPWSVDVVEFGPMWGTLGSNQWSMLLGPSVADASGLPVAQPEETFSVRCMASDGAGTFWRGDGATGWVRIVCAAVADAASLPVPTGDESFATDLLCLTQDLGIVYKWDGVAWGLP